MDDAKENAAVVAATSVHKQQQQQLQHPSWPLPSPHNANSSNNSDRTKKQRRRCPPPLSPSVAASNVGDSLNSRLRKRRAVDLLSHLAVVASVRDLTACLDLLGEDSTAQAAKLAAEEALRGERDVDDKRKKNIKPESVLGCDMRLLVLYSATDTGVVQYSREHRTFFNLKLTIRKVDVNNEALVEAESDAFVFFFVVFFTSTTTNDQRRCSP